MGRTDLRKITPKQPEQTKTTTHPEKNLHARCKREAKTSANTEPWPMHNAFSAPKQTRNNAAFIRRPNDHHAETTLKHKLRLRAPEIRGKTLRTKHPSLHSFLKDRGQPLNITIGKSTIQNGPEIDCALYDGKDRLAIPKDTDTLPQTYEDAPHITTHLIHLPETDEIAWPATIAHMLRHYPHPVLINGRQITRKDFNIGISAIQYETDENITADDIYPRGNCILIEGVSYRLNNFAPYAAFPISEAGQPTKYRFTAYHPNVVVTSRKDQRKFKYRNTSPINTRKTTMAISRMVIKNIEDNQERMHSTIDHYKAVTPPNDQVPEALRHRPNVTTTKDKKGNPKPNLSMPKTETTKH